MRIVVLGPCPPPIGGVTRYSRWLVDLLSGVDGARVTAATVTRGRCGDASAKSGVFLRPWMNLIHRALEYRGSVFVDNYDLFWRSARYRRAVLRFIGRRYALIIHDNGFEGWVSALPSKEREELAAALGRVGLVVGFGPLVMQGLRHLGVSERTATLSQWIPSDTADEVRSAAESRVASMRERGLSIVSTSGCFELQYGFEDVVSAFSQLRSKGLKAGLVVMATGVGGDAGVRRLIDDAQQEWGEDVLVVRDDPGGPALLPLTDVYVRSLRRYPFGLAMREAMAAGVPVVATYHPDLPEGVVTYHEGNAEELAATLESMLVAGSDASMVERARRFVSDEANRNRTATIEAIAAVGRAAQ